MTLRTLLSRFVGDMSGAHAVEFAVILPVLLLLMLGCAQFGLVLLSQSILNDATYDAARQIMVGSLQQSGGGEAEFSTALCGELDLIPCSSVQIDVQSAGSFSSLSPAAPNSSGRIATGFSPGGPQSDVLVEVGYDEPCIVPFVCRFVTSNGGVFLLSTMSFENENY